MMDIWASRRHDEYRTATNNGGGMVGVAIRPDFVCAQCKKAKPALGRKAVMPGRPRYGYLCACCVAKAANKAAEKAK